MAGGGRAVAGRREVPVDPGAGPVQRFACELRKLRTESGGITYRVMARRAGYSITTLSRAAGGEQLPTLPVALAYVAACGGDADAWEARWREAAEEEAARLPEDVHGDVEPPYRGLARYETADSELFFGRDKLTGELLDLVRRERFVAVFGPSGSGKSSLLRAGLVPALQDAQGSVLGLAAIRVLTPGERPFRAQARLLAPVDAETGADTLVIVDQFEEVFTLCHDVAERARFIALLLAARQPGSRLRVIIAVRADFYGHCAGHRHLADAVNDANLLVRPMTPGELREAIAKPAQAVGLIVERALTTRLVREAESEPGGLPLMSHVLRETWSRRRGRSLTVEAYGAAGGLHGAVAKTAEDCYAQLTVEQAELARWILLRLISPGEEAKDARRPAERAELDTGRPEDAGFVLERMARARLITLSSNTVDLAHEALITAWPRLHRWIESDRDRLRLHRRLTEDARAWQDLNRDPGALYRGARLAAAEEAFSAGGPHGELTATEWSFLTAGSRHHTYERRRLRAFRGALALLVVLVLVAGAVAWQQSHARDQRRAEAVARSTAALAENLRQSDPMAAMRLSVAAWRTADVPETRSSLLRAAFQTEQNTDSDPFPDPGAARFLDRHGRTLTTVGEGRIVQREVDTHRQVAAYNQIMDTEDVSPDGRRAILMTPQGARLWDLRKRRALGTSVGSVMADSRFGDSGRSVVVSDSYEGNRSTLEVWSADGRGLLIRRNSERAQALRRTAVSRNDRLLALCPPGGSPEIWDVAKRRKLPLRRGLAKPGVCGGSQGDVRHMRFTPDSRNLAVTTDEGVRMWDVSTGRERLSVRESGLSQPEFSEDAEFLAAADKDEILLWRVAAPARPVFRYQLPKETATHLRLDLERGVLRYLGGTSGTVVRSLYLGGIAGTGWREEPFLTAAFSSDGRTLSATSRRDGRQFFRLRGRHRGTFPAALPDVPCSKGISPRTRGKRRTCVSYAAFTRDGRTFAVSVSTPDKARHRQDVTLFDVAAPDERTIIALVPPEGGGTGPADIALSPDGKTLLVSWFLASEPSTRIELWDVHRRVRTKVLQGGHPNILAFLSGGRRVVISDGTIADLETGRVSRLPLEEGVLRAVASSADGRLLASGNRFDQITLWNGRTRRRLAAFAGTSTSMSRSTEAEYVSALAFSRNGRVLAAAGEDGTVQLWDTESHLQLGPTLPTQGDTILSLAFSRDGNTLYAAGAHVPLYTYPIAPQRLAEDVCRRTGDPLSAADWHALIPDVSYHRTC
ncbi:nSTAND1 domain-containing NTPase [Streptomyces sp. LZ34]